MLQETTDVNTPVTLGPVSPEVRNLGSDPHLTPTISPPYTVRQGFKMGFSKQN